MSKYSSGFEAEVAKALKLLKVKFEYEPKDRKIPYTTTSTYLPDIYLPNGIYCELKGYLRPADRRKMKAIIDQHPELDIRFVFQNPNVRLNKTSKTTYAKWCDQRGIKWGTVKDIPKWAKE